MISPLNIFFTVKRSSTSGMLDDAFTYFFNSGMLKIGTTAPATAGKSFRSGKKSKSVFPWKSVAPCRQDAACDVYSTGSESDAPMSANGWRLLAS